MQGQSDPRLEAKGYTDVPALALHAELAKLPRRDGSAQSSAQETVRTPVRARFVELLSEYVTLARNAGVHEHADSKEPIKVVEVAGVEPALF